MARPGTFINIVLAIALLGASAARLYARPLAHRTAADGRQRNARPVHGGTRSRENRRERRITARAPKLPRAKLAKVAIAPHPALRTGWLAASRKTAAAPALQQALANETSGGETIKGGAAPQTKGDDMPPSIPVPVVDVIRPSIERPQLPSIEDAASTPAILPSLSNIRGHFVLPPALKGSHEILVHQNEMADRDGLIRVQDDSDLMAMRRTGTLIALPVNGAMRVDERLPFNRRYCRPWTEQFLAALARDHYARFHTPLQINSAVRTVTFQQRLLRTNGNAAPATGATASPHLTGQAVDLAKRGMPLEEIAWMRGYLVRLVEAGEIDVEEEFQQACFHISVYRSFGAAPERTIAVTHRDRPAALAIALQ